MLKLEFTDIFISISLNKSTYTWDLWIFVSEAAQPDRDVVFRSIAGSQEPYVLM